MHACTRARARVCEWGRIAGRKRGDGALVGEGEKDIEAEGGRRRRKGERHMQGGDSEESEGLLHIFASLVPRPDLNTHSFATSKQCACV